MNIVARELIDHGPDTVVYGSDWPHTASKESNAAAGGRLVPQDYRSVDDAGILDNLPTFVDRGLLVQRIHR